MGSSNTGTLLNAKSTLGSSSPTSPKNLHLKQSNANLDVIEEELMIEEGCENELENNRVTLQRIRKNNHQSGEELSNQFKRCTITDSELEAVQTGKLDNL